MTSFSYYSSANNKLMSECWIKTLTSLILIHLHTLYNRYSNYNKLTFLLISYRRMERNIAINTMTCTPSCLFLAPLSFCCSLWPQKAFLFQTSAAVLSDCCVGTRGPVCLQALAVLRAGLIIVEPGHSQALERHFTFVRVASNWAPRFCKLTYFTGHMVWPLCL